jgi:hypothetical protein
MELWALVAKEKKAISAEQFFTDPAPAELQDVNPAALAWAEQQIDLERKAQVLEDCWAPWFEGLAVFGETAADPRAEAEASSQTVYVLFNMWERQLHPTGDDRDAIRQAFAGERAYAEKLYGEALDRSGRARLRGYVDTQHRHYLPGYLALRSVVAAWRRTVARPISGAEAFRLLLHMTRFSGFDQVPDLSLPLDEFHTDVQIRLKRWLENAANANGEELERALTMISGEGFRWTGGRLTESSPNQPSFDEELRAQIAELGRQALSALRGDRADPDRVEGASERCRVAMVATGQLLGERPHEPKIFTGAHAPDLINRLAILPLGSVSCPFWLNPENQMLACVIRTTEHGKDSGEPSYDLAVFQLDQDAFDQLADRVQVTGECRMRLTRVADLSEFNNAERGLGRNLLVFQCGDWTHIQPRGTITGSQSVDPDLKEAIVSRLSPDKGIAAPQVLTGPEHPCVRRTLAWIDNTADWTLDADGTPFDLTPWARHVRALADDVITRRQGRDRHEASRLLMEFVLGATPAAERICDAGLTDVRDADAALMDRFVRLLYESGRAPVADSTPNQALARDVTDILATLITHSDLGWDVVLPHHRR